MEPSEFLKQAIEFRNARQWPEAIAALRQAVAADPSDAEAHYHLALSLDESGFSDQAVSVYQRAIAIDPRMAKAYSNLGGILASQCRIEEAIAACRRALQLQPNLPEAMNNLGNAVEQAGLIEYASECYRQAAILSPQKPYFASNYLYSLYFHPRCTPQQIISEHAVWNRLYGEPFRRSVLPHANDRSPGRPLRVGYVCLNFQAHAEAAFLLPLLLNHDPRQVELFCYTDLVGGDAVTGRFKQRAETWRMTRGLSDVALAELIRSDSIDILVDLTMHMSHSRLVAFAQKPAPIQISYLAYPGTTGLWAMDYRLTDRWLDPPGASDSQYTEKLIRLPRIFACYDPAALGIPSWTGAMPARSDVLIFGSRNNFCKINDDVLNLWSRVLLAVPASRMRMYVPSDAGRRSVLDRFSRRGVDSGRIDFVGKCPGSLYWNEYNIIDICLDTLPYSGHTTTLDALWMGCPVVTRVGPTAAGRISWCIYNNLNLTDLAAHDDDQFVGIAVELAGNPARRAEFRRTLRQRMLNSPVMDGPAFARDVEAVYRRAWLDWLAA